MTIRYGDNYTGQYRTKPSEKFPKGESGGGRLRPIVERETLAVATAVGDRIWGPIIPAGSLVLEGFVKISKSLGATGIFELGYLAGDDDVEDTNAFVVSADAGGQAVFVKSDYQAAGTLKRLTTDLQLVARCTEIMDGTVLDAVITFGVILVND